MRIASTAPVVEFDQQEISILAQRWRDDLVALRGYQSQEQRTRAALVQAVARIDGLEMLSVDGVTVTNTQGTFSVTLAEEREVTK